MRTLLLCDLKVLWLGFTVEAVEMAVWWMADWMKN